MGKYLIAVATSDGVHVDTPFGEAERFEVYEITKDAYCKLEERTVVQQDWFSYAEAACKACCNCV